MQKNEQVYQIIENLKSSNPTRFFEDVSGSENGMNFVLLYLSENKNQPVYASTISEKMGISRARIAVLLKKMEERRYITKSKSTDARIFMLKITKQGLRQSQEIKTRLFNLTKKLIEAIGYDELNSFISTAQKIRNVLGEKK